MTAKKALIYISIFIFGFLIISIWNFYTVTHPKRITAEFTPEELKLPSEDVRIQTDDGISLAGWLLEPENTDAGEKRVIIMLHGYPTEKGDILFIARELYPNFTILLMDMRYFGDSGGNNTTLGLKESGDILHVIDFVYERGYTKIGMFGFSLGGATTIMAAEKDSRIGSVASYAAFSDLWSMGLHSYRTLGVFKKPMLSLMFLWGKLSWGELPKSVSPYNSAKNLKIPIHITHSIDDEQVPLSNALEIQKALSENSRAEFLFFDGAPHGALPSEYYVILNEFFDRTL
jgi:uncharacterized protein